MYTIYASLLPARECRRQLSGCRCHTRLHDVQHERKICHELPSLREKLNEDHSQQLRTWLRRAHRRKREGFRSDRHSNSPKNEMLLLLPSKALTAKCGADNWHATCTLPERHARRAQHTSIPSKAYSLASAKDRRPRNGCHAW